MRKSVLTLDSFDYCLLCLGLGLSGGLALRLGDFLCFILWHLFLVMLFVQSLY